MRVGGEASAEDQGVELRAEGAAEVGEAGGGMEGHGGVETAEEGEGVGVRAEREAEGGEEERGEEARVAVAAAGEEEGVGLEELARGGDPGEKGEHAVERRGQRRRRHAGVAPPR